MPTLQLIKITDPGGKGEGILKQLQKLGTEYALNILGGQTDELGGTIVDKP